MEVGNARGTITNPLTQDGYDSGQRMNNGRTQFEAMLDEINGQINQDGSKSNPCANQSTKLGGQLDQFISKTGTDHLAKSTPHGSEHIGVRPNRNKNQAKSTGGFIKPNQPSLHQLGFDQGLIDIQINSGYEIPKKTLDKRDGQRVENSKFFQLAN